jgi:hypothetical protein
MANIPASPYGFKPAGWNRGGPSNTAGQINAPILAAYSYNICYGDVVQYGAGGGAPDTTAGYVRLGAVGVAGSKQAGVFVGCQFIDAAGRTVFSSYWPASNANAGTAFIIPIAGEVPQFFIVAGGDSSGSTSFAIGDVGRNCDLAVGTQSITAGYGLSGMYLDRNTINNTATLPFTVRGLLADISASGATGIANQVLVSSNPANATGY